MKETKSPSDKSWESLQNHAHPWYAKERNGSWVHWFLDLLYIEGWGPMKQARGCKRDIRNTTCSFFIRIFFSLWEAHYSPYIFPWCIPFYKGIWNRSIAITVDLLKSPDFIRALKNAEKDENQIIILFIQFLLNRAMRTFWSGSVPLCLLQHKALFLQEISNPVLLGREEIKSHLLECQVSAILSQSTEEKELVTSTVGCQRGNEEGIGTQDHGSNCCLRTAWHSSLWFPEALEWSGRETAGSEESLKAQPSAPWAQENGNSRTEAHRWAVCLQPASGSDVHALLWCSIFGAFPGHTI